MRLWGLSLTVIVAWAAGACTDRGSITFQVNQPDVAVFNPVTSRLSEYELKTSLGALVAVATVSATSKEAVLPLGALPVTTAPEDMVMRLFSGSELQGLARIRDVAIQKEQQKTYEANVRKPLVFVGSALPAEPQVGNALGDGEILDFTNGTTDLQHPKVPGPGTPAMPDATAAAAVVSDGTLLLAGRPNLLTTYDTGSGISMGISLPFTPVKVVAAPRDIAAVALDASEQMVLFHNLAELRGEAMPTTVALPGVQPRTAVFAEDAIYVLGGGSADPCQPGQPPVMANSITVVTLDGQVAKTWPLPDFVSDIAAGPEGTLILSRSSADQVAKLVPGESPVPEALFNATCPSAVRVSSTGDILVVSSAHQPDFPDSFTLLRGRFDNPTPSQLYLGAPTYEIPTEDVTPPPGQPSVAISIHPKSLFAYDMAVTSDGLRAVFASRIAFHQLADHFNIFNTDCTADLDIVEYGLYVVDTASGNASYEARSQVLVYPLRESDPCIVCPLGFPIGDLPFFCAPGPGDRVGGLAAIFGGP